MTRRSDWYIAVGFAIFVIGLTLAWGLPRLEGFMSDLCPVYPVGALLTDRDVMLASGGDHIRGLRSDAGAGVEVKLSVRRARPNSTALYSDSVITNIS